MNIAVIPARIGSKRIPRKNLKPFAGKRIIEYSIEAARQAALFDRIIVSTDSPELADLARQAGAETPFLRPEHLADDHTPTVPVIRHAIQELQSAGQAPKFICCVYATAPFLRPGDLKQSFEQLRKSKAEFAFPVTTFAFPIFRALRAEPAREASVAPAVEMIWPEHELTRSQDLPEAWHDAGQFYWGTLEAWLTKERIYSANAVGLPIPRFRVQDLDTPEDWQRAEAMYLAIEKNTGSKP